MSDTITCPNCKTEIEISSALSSQLGEKLRREFQAEKERHEKGLAQRLVDLEKREEALTSSEEAVEQEVAARLAKQRQTLKQEAEKKAKEENALEFRDKEAELQRIKAKLEESQDKELQLREKAREIDEERREFELTLNRRLDEERDKIREDATRKAAEERQLKEAEKDKLIADLKRQIDDLKQKSEQGSQRLQGEVMELSLEDLLNRHFPHDHIAAVPKGVHGGDIVQEVHDHSGHLCGTILWETKRTRNWTDAWLPKLRDDQRAAKAQIAVLVSVELPKGVTTFSRIDGVWVTSWVCTMGLAHALRAGLIEVARAKRALVGQQGKMEMLYNYLSGAEFRHRVEGIVEAFVTLKGELDAEKRSVQRLWAKREKQLERAASQTAGLYGDLGGIIGNALPQIQHLELPTLEAPSSEPERSKEGESKKLPEPQSAAKVTRQMRSEKPRRSVSPRRRAAEATEA